MPLSEYEQRVLEQMEQQLTSDDPRLVNTFQGRDSGVRRWLLAGCGALVGLAVLVVGSVIGQPIVGVLGFVAMFLSVVLVLSPPRRRGPTGSVQPDGSVAPRAHRRTSFTQRLEERWERRRDEGQI